MGILNIFGSMPKVETPPPVAAETTLPPQPETRTAITDAETLGKQRLAAIKGGLDNVKKAISGGFSLLENKVALILGADKLVADAAKYVGGKTAEGAQFVGQKAEEIKITANRGIDVAASALESAPDRVAAAASVGIEKAGGYVWEKWTDCQNAFADLQKRGEKVMADAKKKIDTGVFRFRAKMLAAKMKSLETHYSGKLEQWTQQEASADAGIQARTAQIEKIQRFQTQLIESEKIIKLLNTRPEPQAA